MLSNATYHRRPPVCSPQVGVQTPKMCMLHNCIIVTVHIANALSNAFITETFLSSKQE